MRMRFKFKKLLAFVLCVATVFCSVSFAASAAEDATASTEVVQWREENVKHFDMGDGTYQAVMYAHPVHELDEDGNWQDIDFGLSLSQTSGTSVYASEVSGTTFAANYTANQPLMSLSGEDDSISMTLVVPQTGISTWARQTPVAAEVIEPDRSLDTFEEAKEAKFSSTVLYEEVMPGIDLEYIADLYTVKENIIVKEPRSSYAYTFTLNLDGLYPVLMDEGCILIYDIDTDEMKYKIPIPYMYDALGNMSEDVYYTLDCINGVYYLTVTADADWINAENRVFPVAIDPTYVKNTSHIADTYISSTLADDVLCDYPGLWVRANRISYIKTEKPVIPNEGYYLHWASLVTFYYYYDYVHNGYVDVTAHRIDDSWSDRTLTWNIAAEMDNFGLSTEILSKRRASATVGAVVDDPEQLDFDITEAVKDWENGTTNHGIALRFAESSANPSVIFKASESSTDYAPRITYQYGPTFQMTMELQYDWGYNSRYDDGGEGARTRIIDAANTMIDFFWEEYGVDINYTEPEVFSSYADTCLSDYEYSCECGTCLDTDLSAIANLFAVDETDLMEYHHKNIFNIIARLNAPATSLNVTTAFIGHATCRHDTKLGCTESGVRGMAVDNLNVLTINNFIDKQSEIVTLVHEFGHLLGIKDHYGYGCLTLEEIIEQTGDTSYDAACLYGDNYQALSLTGAKVCDGCKNRVAEFVSRYEG